jgi:flavin reductase (DIM6/NTAB) family NADH-FMN oxidoreductase RutF
MLRADRPLQAALTSVDANAFKAAMRCLASGVAVVTSRSDVGISAMTATAVCSVSAIPPLVLVVINQSSQSHKVISSGRAFAVNLLRDDQREVAQYFSASSGKSLNSVPHRFGSTGCPLLEGCAATVECVTDTIQAAGTHSIFIGRVVHAEASAGQPLLYHGGAFSRLQMDETGSPGGGVR